MENIDDKNIFEKGIDPKKYSELKEYLDETPYYQEPKKESKRMVEKEFKTLTEEIKESPSSQAQILYLPSVKKFIKIIQDECSLSIEQRRILQNRAGKDLI